jgi:hypothetical protein
VEKESERDAMLALKGSHHKGGSERASENNARAAAATTRAPRRSRRQRPRGAPQPPHAVLRGPGRATLLCCMHISWLPTYFRRDDTKGLLSLSPLAIFMYVQHMHVQSTVRAARLRAAQAQRALILFLVCVACAITLLRADGRHN